jgi:hypothetical protein
MSMAKQLLDSAPGAITSDTEVLAASIEACFDCAQACTICADTCLRANVDSRLSAHVRRNLDCADICLATGRVLSRQTGQDLGIVMAMLEACIRSCRGCADDCAEQPDIAVCGLCVQACRRCERACDDLMAALKAS